MKISFCTTCMGRAHHLKETLLQNIESNLPHGRDGYPEVEFVLLNYNSQDDMHDWVMSDSDLAPYLADGTLVYAHTNEPTSFHMSHAKNMAHRLATGDILCNLDADNFTGDDFAKHLADIFDQSPNAIIRPSRKAMDVVENHGFAGRIALTKQTFEAIQGYNEAYNGWGREDTDLMIRAMRVGAALVTINDENYLGCVPHSDEERLSNYDPES